MKFDGKIIISDVDGTLTGSDEGIKKNIEAVKYFTANGGRFTLATGRMQYALGSVIPGIIPYINAPGILCNGAYLYDFNTKKTMHEIRLPSEDVMPLLHEINDRFDDVEIRINYRDKFFSPHLSRAVAEQLKNYFTEVKKLDLCDMPKDSFDKVVFFGKPESLEKIREYIISSKKEYALSKSFSSMLELLHKDATKGNQVLYLKSLLGGVKTYCIGDYENDENMLSKSDVSACPSSGLQKIKDMADIVVADCRQGAVASLIEHIEATL